MASLSPLLSTASIDPSQIAANAYGNYGGASLAQIFANPQAANYNGLNVLPTYGSGSSSGTGEDAYASQGPITGYTGVAPGSTVGDTYNIYNPDGSFGQQAQITNGWQNLSDFKDIAQAAALLGGFAVGGQALGAAMGGTGGMFGGAAAGTAAGTTGGAVATPVTGGGALTGADLGTLGTTGATVGAGGTGAALVPGTAEGMSGMDLAADGLSSGGNALNSAAMTSALGAGASGVGGSVLNSLAQTLGVSPSTLMGAGSLLGALAGSQGVQKNVTQTTSLPSYLQGPVTNMLGYANGLLGQQMAPGGSVQQGYQNMQSLGQGLLNGTTQFGRTGASSTLSPSIFANAFTSRLNGGA